MAESSGPNREVRFDIVERIGVIGTGNAGWRKELNLVRWNGTPPKYDIRDWSPDHNRMSRGITLHEDEMGRILELMRSRAEEEASSSGWLPPAAEYSQTPQPAPASVSPASPVCHNDDFHEQDIGKTGEMSEMEEMAEAAGF